MVNRLYSLEVFRGFVVFISTIQENNYSLLQKCCSQDSKILRLFGNVTELSLIQFQGWKTREFGLAVTTILVTSSPEPEALWASFSWFHWRSHIFFSSPSFARCIIRPLYSIGYQNFGRLDYESSLSFGWSVRGAGVCLLFRCWGPIPY